MTIQSAEVIWEPTEDYVAESRVLAFMRRHGIATYEEFYRRSIADIAWFWDAVVREELGLEWFRPYDRVLDLSDGPAWPHWFVGGLFNYTVNALDRHAAAAPDRPAIRWEGEEGTTRVLTYAETLAEVNQLASGLRARGIKAGDRIGIFMPMTPETAIATLACSRLGAIYVPCFSGYGPEAVAARLRDAEARVLITADAYYRRGKVIPMKETADAAAAVSPSVEHVIVARRVGTKVPWTRGRDEWWEDVVAGQPAALPAAETSADDPFMIIYTSGTTGRPKGALHVQAGFPLKAAQDMAHCFDVHPSDSLFWLTDIGWMMGPWAVMGTLILGGTLVLYDGSPDYPEPDRLWALCERHGVTILGISPTVVRALMPFGDDLVRRHDLSALRCSGAPASPGTPIPGPGISRWWAVAAARSSTTRAERRPPVASWAARRSFLSGQPLSPPPCRVWQRMSSTSTGSRFGDRWGSWSSRDPGSG